MQLLHITQSIYANPQVLKTFNSTGTKLQDSVFTEQLNITWLMKKMYHKRQESCQSRKFSFGTFRRNSSAKKK